MPDNSNLTRSAFLYTNDNGTAFPIFQRTLCGTAVGNTVSSTTPSFHISHNKLRHVQLMLNVGGHIYRKKVVVTDVTHPIWSGSPPATVTIGSDTWTVEGRIGERRY